MEISRSEIELDSELGRGAFGRVYKGKVGKKEKKRKDFQFSLLMFLLFSFFLKMNLNSGDQQL
jgi:hypothetical protein